MVGRVVPVGCVQRHRDREGNPSCRGLWRHHFTMEQPVHICMCPRIAGFAGASSTNYRM